MKLDQIVDQPLVETERFTLRPLRTSDAGLLTLYAGDKRVADATRAVPHPLPPGSMEAFITRAQHPDRVEDVWVVDGSASGHAEVAGMLSLKAMDRGQSEISFWVAPAFWNTGIASESIKAMVGANPHGANTLFAEVFQDNPISARVLTNAGFEFIGDAEAFSVARGAKVPTWTYIRKMS